jgi:hypothetical protein
VRGVLPYSCWQYESDAETAMTRTVLLVLPMDAERWEVKREGGDRVYDFFTKRGASLYALTWAKLHKPCDVKVFGPDGVPPEVTSYE